MGKTHKAVSATASDARQRQDKAKEPTSVRQAPTVLYGGLDPEVRRRIEAARSQGTSKVAPFIEAARNSERLTHEDYQIRVSPDVDI